MDQIVLGHQSLVREIHDFNWEDLDRPELSAIARAYYYFSIQFRENLQLACQMYSSDPQLAQLLREECDTANLSPFPGVAFPGERLDHDEFMRRLLDLPGSEVPNRSQIDAAGKRYLVTIRSLGETARAASISTYEDGGLEDIFTSILRARDWDTPMLQGFRHFLEKHILFDSDPEGGHGSMARHLAVCEDVCDLWVAFRNLLVAAVPRLIAHRQPICVGAIS
jgi:hypothetical protein